MAHDPELEREIAGCFTRIADEGWFPEDVEFDSEQLRWIRKLVKPSPGMRVLDAGCARGRFLRGLRDSGARLYGVDLTEAFLNAAQRNLPGAGIAAGSLSRLPFGNASFDAVYCIEVLEHLPDTGAALAEMARVLKPGGVLVVIDKNLLGLHPRNGLPNAVWKMWQERRGRWMYPAEFRFREKWFRPEGLARMMRQSFEQVEVRFTTEGMGLASWIYRLMPVLSFEAVWVGRRPKNASIG